jgi:hypothetical protein
MEQTAGENAARLSGWTTSNIAGCPSLLAVLAVEELAARSEKFY